MDLRKTVKNIHSKKLNRNGEILDLPEMILMHIFSFLNKPQQLITVGNVCSTFYILSSSDQLWEKFHFKYLGMKKINIQNDFKIDFGFKRYLCRKKWSTFKNEAKILMNNDTEKLLSNKVNFIVDCKNVYFCKIIKKKEKTETAIYCYDTLGQLKVQWDFSDLLNSKKISMNLRIGYFDIFKDLFAFEMNRKIFVMNLSKKEIIFSAINKFDCDCLAIDGEILVCNTNNDDNIVVWEHKKKGEKSIILQKPQHK